MNTDHTDTAPVLSAAPAARAARPGRRAVRLWLITLAGLVALMVGVGGATRLTGSGLSITEWRPVTGALPPLSHQAWEAEFAKYRDSPQYRLLNEGMSLDAFRFIYAWEWGHRQLGRLIGLAFFAPLAWFWWRRRLGRRQAGWLLGLGLIGGLQGAVGWIMVASGLEPGMTAVAPARLALHLMLASAILAGLVWSAAGLGERAPTAGSWPAAGGGRSALVLLLLIIGQIGLGGLVAGSRAGLTYNTWPLMDGALAPSAAVLFARTPLVENFIDNPALVQLDHRLMAYLVVGFAAWHAWRIGRHAPGTAAARRAAVLAGLALAQAALGVATLVLVVPLWAGLAHQAAAMALLAFAAAHARLSVAERPHGAAEASGPGRPFADRPWALPRSGHTMP